MKKKLVKKYIWFLIATVTVAGIFAVPLAFKKNPAANPAVDTPAGESVEIAVTESPENENITIEPDRVNSSSEASVADEVNDSVSKVEPVAEAETVHSTAALSTNATLLRKDKVYTTFPAGALYSSLIGYVYVPFQVTEQMPCVVYITGGGSGFTLAVNNMKAYLIEYKPDAIILFTMISGYDEGMTPLSKDALDVLKTAFNEAGCEMSQVIVSGISLGAYTAFECAAVMAREGLPVKTVIAMDPGLDWFEVKAMDEETCSLMAEKEIRFIIFENSLLDLDPEPLKRMQAAGIDMQLIKCAQSGHDGLCSGLLQDGIISWALGETEELNQEKYGSFTQDEALDGIMIKYADKAG